MGRFAKEQPLVAGDWSIFRRVVASFGQTVGRKHGPVPLTLARGGATILEMTVAAALVGTLLMLCLHLVSATAAQRRAMEQRQAAIFDLANVMERLTARPWQQLTPETAAKEEVAPATADLLPKAELKVAIVAPSNDPAAKRITASLRWQNRGGQFVEPLTLTAWRYNRGERGEGRGAGNEERRTNKEELPSPTSPNP